MQPLPPSEFARIVALHEDVQFTTYSLETEICTIGRASECQVVVRRIVVSRLHARIERNGPRYILHDAGSANGTFVNSRRIREPHLLRDHDLIGLGAVNPLLRFIDPDPTLVPAGRLRYDEQALLFFLDQQQLDLTPAQFRLLFHLYQHSDQVCSRESCAQVIWGQSYSPDLDVDALDRAINKLRTKLRRVDPTIDLIKTRRGLGYELVL
jgi:DNA-binding response OmpR family regulator